MPVQNTDLASTLVYTAVAQTWLITSGVTVTSPTNEGVLSTYAASSLLNHGLVFADADAGVRFSGANGYVYNAAGAEIAGRDGVRVHTGSQVVNWGVITSFIATGTGIVMGGNAQVDNHGEVFSRGVAIYVNGVGSSAIYNSGLLSGDFEAINVQVSGPSVLVNSGIVESTGGRSLQITSGSGSSVINTGSIFGEIRLVSPAAPIRVVNSGDIFGDIYMNDGPILYDGRRGAMNGYEVIGNAHNDVMKGGADDDLFRGAGGVDNLTGKGGDDVLIGGGLGDLLRGGAGADSFVYLAKTDSTGAARDTITDFSTAERDVIDLSAIDADRNTAGNQAFTLIGTAAFTNTAGELRYAVPGSSAIVTGDVDGDGTADFSILVADVTTLKDADFVL